MSKYYFGVQCAECKKRLFSFYVHDYKTCSCPNSTMVDGGTEYLRVGWKKTPPKRVRFTERLDGPYPDRSPVKEPRWPY